MIPEKAIEKALAGGWKPWWLGKPIKISHSFIEVMEREQIVFQWWQEIALDTTFWNGLGTAYSWYSLTGSCSGWFSANGIPHTNCTYCNSRRFLELIMQNKGVVDFWEQILV